MTRGRRRGTRKLIQYYGEEFARKVEEEKRRRRRTELPAPDTVRSAKAGF